MIEGYTILLWGALAISTNLNLEGSFFALEEPERNDLKAIDAVTLLQGTMERKVLSYGSVPIDNDGIATNCIYIETNTFFNNYMEMKMEEDPVYPGYEVFEFDENLEVYPYTISDIYALPYYSHHPSAKVIPKIRYSVSVSNKYGPLTEWITLEDFFATNTFKIIPDIPTNKMITKITYNLTGPFGTIISRDNDFFYWGEDIDFLQPIQVSGSGPNYPAARLVSKDIITTNIFPSHYWHDFRDLIESYSWHQNTNVYTGDEFDIYRRIKYRGNLIEEEIPVEVYSNYMDKYLGDYVNLYGVTQQVFTFTEEQIINNFEYTHLYVTNYIPEVEGVPLTWTNYYTPTNYIPVEHAFDGEKFIKTYSLPARPTTVFTRIRNPQNMLTTEDSKFNLGLMARVVTRFYDSISTPSLTNFDSESLRNYPIDFPQKQTVSNAFYLLEIGDRTNKFTGVYPFTSTNIQYLVLYTNYPDEVVCYTSEFSNLIFDVIDENGHTFKYLTATESIITTNTVEKYPFSGGEKSKIPFKELYKILNACKVTDLKRGIYFEEVYRGVSAYGEGSPEGIVNAMRSGIGDLGYSVSTTTNIRAYPMMGKSYTMETESLYGHVLHKSWKGSFRFPTKMIIQGIPATSSISLFMKIHDYTENYSNTTYSIFNDSFGPSNSWQEVWTQNFDPILEEVSIDLNIASFSDYTISDTVPDAPDAPEHPPGSSLVNYTYSTKGCALGGSPGGDGNFRLIWKPEFEYCREALPVPE